MSDYTDIQQELDDFKNAVYGEEVRGSMVSAIKKIHDIAESAAGAPDATTATAGQVLTADGNGGHYWGNVETEVDSSLSATSTNPVQNKVIYEALNEVNERLAQLEHYGNGINDAAIYYLTKVLETALYKTDASADIVTLINTLKGVDGIVQAGENITVDYLLNDTAEAVGGYIIIT